MDNVCPDCGGKLRYDQATGEVMCTKCGVIVERDVFDYGQEWREFNWDQAMNRRRSGTPTSFTKSDKGMTTEIGTASDIYSLSGDQRKQFFIMRKWQRRISTPIERNIKFALTELRRIGAQLNLPNIINEESARIYRIAAENGLVRGRSMESVVAGATYIACKKYKIPRTLREIADVFPLDVKEVGKTYRFVCRQLGIKILPPDPLDYVYRFANELELSPKVQTKAIEIIEGAQSKEITSGKGPTGIAAASLYIASLIEDEKRTQREVADVAGVTEVTIRNRYKELLKKLDLEEKLAKLGVELEAGGDDEAEEEKFIPDKSGE